VAAIDFTKKNSAYYTITVTSTRAN